MCFSIFTGPMGKRSVIVIDETEPLCEMGCQVVASYKKALGGPVMTLQSFCPKTSMRLIFEHATERTSRFSSLISSFLLWRLAEEYVTPPKAPRRLKLAHSVPKEVQKAKGSRNSASEVHPFASEKWPDDASNPTLEVLANTPSRMDDIREDRASVVDKARLLVFFLGSLDVHNI